MRSVLLFLIIAGSLGAQVRPVDPLWPAQERARYTETVGKVTQVTEATLVKRADPARWEFRWVSVDQELLFRLDPATFLVTSSESVSKTADATVRRTTEYRELKPRLGPDDWAVTDFSALPLVLRAFPWGQRTTAKLVLLGNASGANFAFDVTVNGRETVAAAGRSWDCWKVTTSLGGPLGLLVPKSEWWFAVEGSHPLIKTVGPSGAPGSPARTLVLQSIQGD